MRASRVGGPGVVLIVAVALVLGLPVQSASADVPGPTITVPAEAATVSGVVTVTAESTAPFVQFGVQGLGAIGSPIAVVSGSASTTWDSWGFANGAQIFLAAECASVSSCNPFEA